MKLKDGKELSQLEIIKRLNIMGIGYNPEIIGKKYYIDLYNEAIRSSKNKQKIKKDIEKDQMYLDFYNQKLRKRKECSFAINTEKNILYNNINNYDYKYNFNDNNLNNKKYFFTDFNGGLLNKIAMAHLCYSTYDYARNNTNQFEKIYNKFIIPINAIKKFTTINIYPEIKKRILQLLDIIDSLIIDEYSYMIFLSFLMVILTVFILIIKRYKH